MHHNVIQITQEEAAIRKTALYTTEYNERAVETEHRGLARALISCHIQAQAIGDSRLRPRVCNLAAPPAELR